MAKIIMDLEWEPSEEEIRHMRYLFADALADFARVRGPSAEEYVERRYPRSDSSPYKTGVARGMRCLCTRVVPSWNT